MTALAERWGIHPEHFWLYGRRPERLVRFDEQMDAWNVYGYPEAMEVLGDPGTFSSDTAKLLPMGMDESFTEGDLLQTDPPDHRELRKLVSHAFTPKVVADLEPRITEVTRELLDAVADEESFDLMGSLAYPLPVTVVAELLSIPAADRYLLEKWMRGMTESLGDLSMSDDTAEQERVFEQSMAPMREMLAYLREHTAACRGRRRQDDLLGRLIEARVGGERLTDNHIVNFGKMLLIAGYLTTTMLIGNTVLCLDNYPEQAAKVRADRSLVPGLLEESMRYLSPVAATYRATTREVEVAGQRMEPGKMVLVWYGAANRDERQFTDPHAFDVTRERNAHLGFGRGIHFCLGAPLARMEGRVAMNLLFDRFSEIRTDPERTPVFSPGYDTTGVNVLPVRVTRA
ncbi:cytochrome P450 [Streptomyces yaizuensis]|uniref:Cytochrome P450 n=1 Tax=Streptomyces yaizuensis TaxID=2989713 RepID=A0ABQ5P9B0_9ACTN|nr:cytochrome P450 [Streptomyces sp. YSPA8]GLF99150.1 cytochrome P450 [Streptomyces sp. YSPA8]